MTAVKKQGHLEVLIDGKMKKLKFERMEGHWKYHTPKGESIKKSRPEYIAGLLVKEYKKLNVEIPYPNIIYSN
jgi:hypothetical protein